MPLFLRPPAAPRGPASSASGDPAAAAVRRRLVRLAVGCANTLAELVGLAFEVDEAGSVPVPSAAAACGEPPWRGIAPPPASGTNGTRAASPLARPRIPLRAVTDSNLLLVEQLRRLLDSVERQERWRSARPGELWRGLLLQLARLFPLVASLEAGALPDAQARELAALIADATTHLAFLRFYPRLPTA